MAVNVDVDGLTQRFGRAEVPHAEKAQAIVNEPGPLLLDEPTSGLAAVMHFSQEPGAAPLSSGGPQWWGLPKPA